MEVDEQLERTHHLAQRLTAEMPGICYSNWNFSLETNYCTEKQIAERKRQKNRMCFGLKEREREAQTSDKPYFFKK